MKRTALILLMFLVGAMLPLGSAQFNNEWEFGWDTDVEPSYDLALDGEKWKIEDTLVFFVDNPRINDLSLTIVVEFDDDIEFIDASFEESITVSAQSNETFSIELTTSDADAVRSHSPSDKITIVVTAEENTGGALASPKEIDANLNVPRHHKLLPEVALVVNSVDAGTWVEETIWGTVLTLLAVLKQKSVVALFLRSKVLRKEKAFKFNRPMLMAINLLKSFSELHHRALIQRRHAKSRLSSHRKEMVWSAVRCLLST